MPRYAVLLRGVNLGPRNRVGMPRLREALEGAGYDEVVTYLQSGNVVLSSRKTPAGVARDVRRLVGAEFGIDVAAIVRTRSELAAVVKANPLGKIAKNEKRYQVTFLEAKPKAPFVRELEQVAVGGEKVVARGRELYAWHPAGVGRSKLAALLAGPNAGGTARNWTTVTKLLELTGSP
jgi:uncharacterized protein (DUF1697 family)